MKYGISAILICLVCLAATELNADVIYMNDFGTEAQRTAGATGQWTESVVWGVGSSVQYAANGFLGCSAELDGDGLHGTLYVNNTGGTVTMWSQKLDAPEGFKLSNISITGRGWGNKTSYGATYSVGLSDDGATWDYSASGYGDYWAWNYAPSATRHNTATASAGTDAAYTDVDSVWIMIKWNNVNNAQQVSAPAICDVVVNADLVEVPEPATMIVLLGGAAGTIIRRKNNR